MGENYLHIFYGVPIHCPVSYNPEEKFSLKNFPELSFVIPYQGQKWFVTIRESIKTHFEEPFEEAYGVRVMPVKLITDKKKQRKWNSLLKKFFIENNQEPEMPPHWFLSGHYN